MKPLAVALTILQAEKNMFIGFLQPTIKGLLRELNKRATDSALVYSGLIPSLKFTWLEGQEKEEALHTFKEELGSNEDAPLEKNYSCDTSDDEANFFNVVKRGKFPQLLMKVTSPTSNSKKSIHQSKRFPAIQCSCGAAF
ncbi:hypothetical protein J437_LFUL010165 [Ladona fulva]|uniref:Uncharacterized protein n=1 Tax=Ladona fulva TaxID=123851 RepID=A0A8K0KAG8_LADFU|nr:hypothetical protein J437_LFUL010165 [Ladona fulva]